MKGAYRKKDRRSSHRKRHRPSETPPGCETSTPARRRKPHETGHRREGFGRTDSRVRRPAGHFDPPLLAAPPGYLLLLIW